MKQRILFMLCLVFSIKLTAQNISGTLVDEK